MIDPGPGEGPLIPSGESSVQTESVVIDQLADKTGRAYVRSSTLGLFIPPTAA
jgi:hypothetical protein